MYKLQCNNDLLVDPIIRTRWHDGKIFRTLKPNYEKFKKKTLYRGPVIWNGLRAATRNIPSFEEFKLYLKKWAKDNNLNV